MKLSVVIPAFNEERTIEDTINECYFANEIVVVDDGSTDKTGKICKDIGVHYIKNRVNQGHPATLVKGLKAAQGDHVLYIDADNQIHASDCDYDLISGYRVHRKDKLFRKIISFILKMVIFIRHRMWIRDANCPFKVFKKTALNNLLAKLPEKTYVPSVEFEVLARKLGYKVLEIPVYHYVYPNRKGFLQALNKKSRLFFWNAFKEVWTIK